MKKIIAIFICCVLCVCLLACDGNDVTPTNLPGSLFSNTYFAAPAKKTQSGQLPSYSCRDDQKYYYFWYLGELQCVPLQSSFVGANANYYDGRINYDAKFQVVQSTEEAISQTLSEASTKCTSWTNSVSTNIGTSTEIGVEVGNGGIFKGTAKTAFELGVSLTGAESGATEKKISESIEEATTQIETYSKEISVSFGNDMPIGWYRYVLFGNIEVYAYIVYDLNEKSIYYGNTESIKNTIGFGFEYTDRADGAFEKDRYAELPFECPNIEDLITNHIPENYVSIDVEIGDQEENNVIDFAGGNGTAQRPYIISNTYHLINIGKEEYNKSGTYFRLSNDIKVNANWTPIPNFYGILDGSKADGSNNCYTIEGLKFLFYDGADVDWGMFTKLESGAEVKNIIFKKCNASFIAPNGQAVSKVKFGFVATYNYGTITNCIFTENIIDIDADSKVSNQFVYVGTAVCENYGSINGCKVNNNNINVDSDTVRNDSADDKCAVAVAGGLCAYNQKNAFVIDCSSSGNIIKTRVCYIADEGEDVKAVSGGLIGFLYGNASESSNSSSGNTLTAIKRYYKAKWGLFGNLKGTECKGEESGDWGELYARS